ncbi:MAG: hypothetical protein ACE5F6_00410 [Anaerolineae bacterium]
MSSPAFFEYVRRFGTRNQKERLAAGVAIPDKEADTIIYKAIWKEYGGWFKRKRLTENEVREIAIMHRMAQPGDPVRFEVVEPADELTEVQWTCLKAIRQIGKVFNARVTPFWVISHCGRKHLKKAYGRVEFELDERPYRIELCLELPTYPNALTNALEMAAKE